MCTISLSVVLVMFPDPLVELVLSCFVFHRVFFIQQLALMGEPEENSGLQTVTRGSDLLRVGSAQSLIIHETGSC